jgi:hypothetical protein
MATEGPREEMCGRADEEGQGSAEGPREEGEDLLPYLERQPWQQATTPL